VPDAGTHLSQKHNVRLITLFKNMKKYRIYKNIKNQMLEKLLTENELYIILHKNVIRKHIYVDITCEHNQQGFTNT
jgi:hypothetical protein